MAHRSESKWIFPDPETADDSGVVAIGADLLSATLRDAYRRGIFPWPHEGYPLLWFSPPERAILDFRALHIPRRLVRERRRCGLTFTLDQAFPAVIAACRSSFRPGQDGTWITPAMERGYCALHREGDAHSVEAWDADGNLVGGLYGVDSGGAFSGESMFYRAPNASKLALLFLVDHLRDRGLDFLDIQQLTPHLRVLGAREIPRREFLRRWQAALAAKRDLFP